MKDYVTAKERLSNPRLKQFWLDAACLAFCLAITIYYFYELTNEVLP